MCTGSTGRNMFSTTTFQFHTEISSWSLQIQHLMQSIYVKEKKKRHWISLPSEHWACSAKAVVKLGCRAK